MIKKGDVLGRCDLIKIKFHISAERDQTKINSVTHNVLTWPYPANFRGRSKNQGDVPVNEEDE